MPKLTDQEKKAYTDLEQAIDAVLRLRGAKGVLVEYVTLAGMQMIDDDGDTTGSVLMILPMGGGIPYHKVMGLLDYTHTVLRAEVARNEMGTSDDGE